VEFPVLNAASMKMAGFFYCCAMKAGKTLPTFQKCDKYRPNDGCSKNLQNVGELPPPDSAQHQKTAISNCSLLITVILDLNGALSMLILQPRNVIRNRALHFITFIFLCKPLIQNGFQ
jgi:hypothetical protein